MIREDVLSEAALELLASSTARRYMRQAQRLAASSGLVDAVRSDPKTRSDAHARVTELLRQLENERERSPAEFEAALLLCALARADGFSKTVRQAKTSPSAWLRSLALRLISLGPASSEEISALEDQIASVLSGQVVVGEPLEASDRSDPASFPRAA
jgi:hypothetical protein